MSDRQKRITHADRECIQCAAIAPFGRKTSGGGKADGYEMLSITPLLYVPGRGKIRAGTKVNICDPCFAKAMTSTVWRSRLWGALRDRLTWLYKKNSEGGK